LGAEPLTEQPGKDQAAEDLGDRTKQHGWVAPHHDDLVFVGE
jgi:hypothetical protein